MRYATWMLCMGILLAGSMQADDPPAQKSVQDEVQKQLSAIQSEWNTKRGEFFKKFQEINDQNERAKFYQKEAPKFDTYAERVLKLANENPTAPKAADAVLWCFMNGVEGKQEEACAKWLKSWITRTDLPALNQQLKRYYYLNNREVIAAVFEKVKSAGKNEHAVPLLVWVSRQGVYSDQAAKVAGDAQKLMLDQFIEAPELGDVCMSLADSEDAKATETLKKILDKTKHEDVKAKACLALGKQYAKKELTHPDAEKMFERVLKEFPKLDKNVKNMASGELNELKFLSVGKPALEIAGKDLDDKEFKLSDYKGKVVLLDFWGFW
ncbi:MAG: hypothetical protein JNJ77_09050 [Planctomycetia bacterium]|nr:hypothetical protein [Planctomycetia bacterium]